jgi:nucleotide-binding universal stress UspA family protein
MLSIQTILCPTDFSVHSDNAFRMACALARDYGARVVVLHVAEIPVPAYVNEAIMPPVEPNLDELRESLADYAVPDGSLNVERLLLEGEPLDEIVALARQMPADLIVMGTHGRSGISRLLMGSVAEAVLRAAPCPVLTLRTQPTYVPAEEMALAAGGASPY